jgi:4-amino-4-deoxy-L-arabinose transferase-like glycosyltransferase
VSRRSALVLVAAAAAAPRLAVLLHERSDILAAFTEKSDDFARTFVESGTFGFAPGDPSAWTQPLYAWFLIPIYWIFGREWWAVGLAQLAVAVATALLVYEIGRRFVSHRAGLVAAIIATLNPYLVWHDMHVNRELLDTLLAAAVVLLTLLAAERPRALSVAALLGVALGLAILGNTRLLLLPLVVAGYLVWRTRALRSAAAAVAVCALALLPWAIRNEVSVGCFTLGTDTKALWKANNANTYDTLAAGGWIDDVPDPKGAPPTPEMAGAIYRVHRRRVPVDECAQMRFYRSETFDFWSDHPGEKGRLAGQAVRMLWDPRALRTEGRAEAGGAVDAARIWVQPLYEIPLYALALIGLFLLPRRVSVLILALLAYQTLVAIGFAGSTRYRVAWDFTLALAAAPALLALASRAVALVRRPRLSADGST